MTGVTHHGEYNPWEKLKDPEFKKAYDEAVATGGFAYRTGYTIIHKGRVYIDEDNVLRSEPATFTHVNDDLHLVRFA